MPRFEPFAGIRYAPSVALESVTAPPYDVLSEADVRALAARDPHNIVRIDVPLESEGPGRYDAAAARLQQWLADGVLVLEASPVYYRHRMTFLDELGAKHVTTGFIGGIDVLPHGTSGDVLPHEQTTPKAKTDRLDLTRATHTNMSAVWGLSLAPGFTELGQLPAEVVGDFTDDDGVRHELAVVREDDSIATIQRVVGSAPVVIADGHHRYDISRTYRAERRGERDEPGPYDLTMTFVVALTEDELFVQAIHRLLTDLPTDLDLAGALEPFFELVPAGVVTASITVSMRERGAMCLVDAQGNGTFLVPRPAAFVGLRDLDSLRLERALADIEHTKTYQHGVDHVLEALHSGRAEWAVLLRPVGIAEIRRTADEGVLMPPKSTFFAPKPRTGLVIRPV